MANRRDPQNSKSQLLRLALSKGANSDGDAQVVPVTDLNNVVMLKDGSGITNRGGLEVRNHYNVYGVPAGKKVILKESAPPDVDLGNMFMVMNPTLGNPRVDYVTFMRDRTQLEAAAIYAVAQFDISANPLAVSSSAMSVTAPYNNDLDIGYITRTGDLSRASSLLVSTINGTAVSGTDFSGFTNTVYGIAATALQGSFIKVTNVNSTAGKYFYVQFSLNTTDTTTMLATPTRITITMV